MTIHDPALAAQQEYDRRSGEVGRAQANATKAIAEALRDLATGKAKIRIRPLYDATSEPVLPAGWDIGIVRDTL